jgi:hypothetical protein
MTSAAAGIRRAILLTHRWLGIAGGLLFVLWFASGIAMLWARMPGLDPAEALRRRATLDLDSARVDPGEAARVCECAPAALRITMLGDRPVYRFASERAAVTVFADDGRRLEPVDRDEALRLARVLYPEHASTARYDCRLESSDQWTLENSGSLPLHRIMLGDAGDTWVYLAETSGELVMSATRSARRRAYVSAVPHWLYFTPLRRTGPLWGQLVIWVSLAGCVLAASGLVWGVWQTLRARVGPGSAGGDRAILASPYRGLMRWHHYAGLVFGLFTFTWVLSGGLSMDPFDWHSPTEPTADQTAAVAGGSPRFDDLTLERLRAAFAAVATKSTSSVKALVWVGFRGEPYLVALSATEMPPREIVTSIVPAHHPERGVFPRFDRDDLEAAARAALPAAAATDSTWLEQHDDYYYDLHGPAPLPVLRVRFDDPARTWLYLDPSTGTIVRREDRSSRLNRWIYHGLHSFDFPFLARRRAVRDTLAVLLSLGGLLVALTSMADGWRRVARHLRRVRSADDGSRQ